MEAHRACGTRAIADVRVNDTTGEVPLERFRRDEAGALRPLDGRPPIRQRREPVRRVQLHGAIALNTNA